MMMPHYMKKGRSQQLVLPYGHECIGLLPAHKQYTPKYFVIHYGDGEIYYVDTKSLECKGAHNIDMSYPN